MPRGWVEEEHHLRWAKVMAREADGRRVRRVARGLRATGRPPLPGRGDKLTDGVRGAAFQRLRSAAARPRYTSGNRRSPALRAEGRVRRQTGAGRRRCVEPRPRDRQGGAVDMLARASEPCARVASGTLAPHRVEGQDRSGDRSHPRPKAGRQVDTGGDACATRRRRRGRRGCGPVWRPVPPKARSGRSRRKTARSWDRAAGVGAEFAGWLVAASGGRPSGAGDWMRATRYSLFTDH